MFLLEPTPTPWDLNFRIFAIPVRVHPMFWAIMALFGWDYIHFGLGYVLLWIGCAFVSILVHELGHVFMGQAFGNRSHIVLYGFGGMAIGSNRERRGWQRIAVAAAGPLAGFLLYGIVLVAANQVRPDGPFRLLPYWSPRDERPALTAGLHMLCFMNLFWNSLNLLPIWPLDGGHVSREVFVALSPSNGVRISLGLSFLVAAGLALHALMLENGWLEVTFLPFLGGMYMVLFFAMLAIQSFQQWQDAAPRRRIYEEEDDRLPWERQR